MASEKTKKSWAALIHVITYGIPFLFLKPSNNGLIFIVATHLVIDRWRLARYVVWAKNWLGYEQWLSDAESPSGHCWRINQPWEMCKATGYSPDRPVWLTTWLLIISDNTLHLLCNGIALSYL